MFLSVDTTPNPNLVRKIRILNHPEKAAILVGEQQLVLYYSWLAYGKLPKSLRSLGECLRDYYNLPIKIKEHDEWSPYSVKWSLVYEPS